MVASPKGLEPENPTFNIRAKRADNSLLAQ
jgi:hypothetical protein